MVELTPTEQKIVDTIKSFKEKVGVEPTQGQMREVMGMSRANVSMYIGFLKKKGVVKNSTKAKNSVILQLL